MPKFKEFCELSKRQKYRRIAKAMKEDRLVYYKECGSSSADVQCEQSLLCEEGTAKPFLVKVEKQNTSTLFNKLGTWALKHNNVVVFDTIEDENDVEYENVASSSYEELNDPEPGGSHSEEHEHTCCKACRRDNVAIMKKLDKILQFLGADPVEKDVDPHETSSINMLPEMPFCTAQELLEFDQALLENEELRRQFRNKISLIGGKNGSTFIRHAFAAVMTDEVGRQFSWTGLKQSIPTKNRLFATMILDIVQSVHKETYDTLRKAAQEWLHHAGDRWRYKQKKNNCTIAPS